MNYPINYFVPLLIIIAIVLCLIVVYLNYRIKEQKLFYKFFMEQLFKSADHGSYDEAYSQIYTHLNYLNKTMKVSESDRKHFLYYNDVNEDSVYSSEEELNSMM
tara:strand:+ start:405 stop:716 length:312 start_codon:yes stop_codon:yes gene_type:complete